jgi:hypothetical protein
VFGNPISLIDPNGRNPDNTIFADEDGNVLYQTKDDLDDAIVVVGNDQKAGFLAATNALQNSDNVTQGDIAELRGFGNSYMVDGMIALENESLSVSLPSGSHDYVDKNGNPLTNVHPEAGSYFNISEDGKTLSVDMSRKIISNSTAMVGLGGTDPAIHNHPIHGGLYVKNSEGIFGPAKEMPWPSSQDNNNSGGRQKRQPSRYRDVIVAPEKIYFKHGNSTVGRFKRSFFNK